LVSVAFGRFAQFDFAGVFAELEGQNSDPARDARAPTSFQRRITSAAGFLS
jgi:hypothetical protein